MLARRLALCASVFALSAGLAHAQSLTIAPEALATATIAAAPAQRSGLAAPGDRAYNPRVFVGAWTNSGSGMLVGGGIAAHPFEEPRHELQGNLAYLHVEESNGFDIDLNYAYNFVEKNAGSWTPLAGAGLNIVHAGDTTDTGLQVGGGLKRMWNGWQVLGEVWFAFNASNPIIIRAGLGW